MQDYALGAFNLCPNLKLEKTPDTGSFFVGDQFNWTLHVTNSGAAATAVTVSDTIPASLQIVGTPSFDKNPGSGSDGTCGVVGQVVTCNVGALGANDGNAAAPENDTVDVTIKVKALASGDPGRHGRRSAPTSTTPARSPTRARRRTRRATTPTPAR